jgi:hypothetical protein
MARGGHGLPKVSHGPAMPNPSTPFGRATPEIALRSVSGVTHPQGGQPAAVFYPFGHPTPYAYERDRDTRMRNWPKTQEKEILPYWTNLTVSRRIPTM